MMSPHQRILATLERQPTDRFAVDVWLTPEMLDALRKDTEIEDELSLYQHLGLDKMVWVFPGYRTAAFDPNESDGIDPWGVPMKRIRSGAATYMEYGEPPLAKLEDPEELDDYPLWPDPAAFHVHAAKEKAERARSHQFATIGPWVSFFEVYCHLRGMENALMDVVAEPEFLSATLDRIEAIQTVLLERCLTEMGDLLDMVFISDDMGTQESLLLSTGVWREHFQPRLKRWCDLIHRHGKKVLFHTDGAVRPLLPDLIDCGIDILNPIQHICPGMERTALQKDFGASVIFHGGVDNQHVLPHGTVEDVRRETLACLRELGRDGGTIICSCHNVQAGTPVENVRAMIDTVHEYQA